MNPPYEPQPVESSGPKDFLAGVGYLFRGLGWIARRPGQWFSG